MDEGIALIIESIVSLSLRILVILFLFGLGLYGVFALIVRIINPI